MPYDRHLAARVRAALARRRGVTEKPLFGCLGFFLNGNVFLGVWRDSLIARLGPDAEDALREPCVRPFDITGKPMRNWVAVGPDGVRDDRELADWVRRAMAFGRTLPGK
jgi:TfoX/Sxy family transcriptional regulator of competence genes